MSITFGTASRALFVFVLLFSLHANAELGQFNDLQGSGLVTGIMAPRPGPMGLPVGGGGMVNGIIAPRPNPMGLPVSGGGGGIVNGMIAPRPVGLNQFNDLGPGAFVNNRPTPVGLPVFRGQQNLTYPSENRIVVPPVIAAFDPFAQAIADQANDPYRSTRRLQRCLRRLEQCVRGQGAQDYGDDCGDNYSRCAQKAEQE